MDREQRIHTTQIYRLYEELKRYNDRQLENGEERENGQKADQRIS